MQVLNEFASVGLRKFGLSLIEIREILDAVRATCTVQPLDLDTHTFGLSLVERDGFSLYDGMIVAAASLSNCNVLYSEDMQHGRVIEGMRIKNPFRSD